jgi:hypothetical protein
VVIAAIDGTAGVGKPNLEFQHTFALTSGRPCGQLPYALIVRRAPLTRTTCPSP